MNYEKFYFWFERRFNSKLIQLFQLNYVLTGVQIARQFLIGISRNIVNVLESVFREKKF